MSADGLTPGGQRLALHYARTLGLVAHVTRAAASGDYPALADLAGALSTEADELAAAASYVTTEARPTAPRDLLAAVDHGLLPSCRDA